MKHCCTASRPGIVWFELSLLGQSRCLPDELLRVIHGFVRVSLPEERDGVERFRERLERQAQERKERGAEPPARLWQLLRFSCLNEFIAERRLQRDRERARDAPDWVLFGFKSNKAYKTARKRARGELRS
jgi:hypothetical protein